MRLLHPFAMRHCLWRQGRAVKLAASGESPESWMAVSEMFRAMRPRRYGEAPGTVRLLFVTDLVAFPVDEKPHGKKECGWQTACACRPHQFRTSVRDKQKASPEEQGRPDNILACRFFLQGHQVRFV